MNKAILTKGGADRIGAPELEGEVVEYEIHKLGTYATCIFYKGERIAGILSITGEEAGLIPVE